MASIDCDFLVIGSGAAGLTAAATAAIHGLDVVVAERASVLGGTTAWSGGWMWLPRNHFAREAGIVEDFAEPRRYLAAVLGDDFDSARIDTFLKAAPEAVDFLERHGLVFEPGNSICDIYADRPGAGRGGRSLIAAAFDGRQLGQRISLLRSTMRATSLVGMPIQAGTDLAAFLTARKNMRSALHVGKRLLRHLADLALHGRAMQLVNGVALVARLFQVAEEYGVRFIVDANATSLVDDGNRVTGAELDTPTGPVTVRARRAVMLATGGFSQSAELRTMYFPHPELHRSLAVPEADGAGLRLAAAFGGALDSSGAAPGAWCPVSKVRWPDGSRGIFPHIIDRGKPGIIAVLANGRRFVNEADGYHDYVTALLTSTSADVLPRSWLICDHHFIRRWGLGIVKPAPVPMKWWLRSGYLRRAVTLDSLAQACGIAPELTQTVAEYNVGAREGRDEEFRRGWSAYNRYQGERGRRPNPNVAPIEQPPFYAVEVAPGSFGSFAGLSTDARARVLRTDGSPIDGLYSAGADAANVMGGHYPAGGINLGPAITFGYLAGRDAGSISG